MTQLQNRTIAELQNCRSAELQKWFGCVCFGFAVLAASAAHAADPSGEEVYKQHCAACHDQVSPRIPPRESLKTLSAARILRSLDFGAMMSIAYPLKREQRESVARFLGKSDSDDAPRRENVCPTARRIMASSASASWNGWSPGSSNARYQGAREAGITPAQVRNLKLKWALGFAGDITALGAPTIVSGTLLLEAPVVRSRRLMFRLGVRTGCFKPTARSGRRSWRFRRKEPPLWCSAIKLAGFIQLMPSRGGSAGNDASRNTRRHD
jgi:hypothetical protein